MRKFLAGALLVGVALSVIASRDTPTRTFVGQIPAEVTRIDSMTLSIRGELNEATLNLVKKEFGKPPQISMVNLESPGGSVDAGMAMGRIFREHQVMTQVGGYDVECASSCIFAFVGGTWRYAGGKVGVHRPYLDNTSLTESEIRSSSVKMDEKIRTYFREMNITQRLADDIMTVPLSQIRWLTQEEMSRYNLVGVDPVYEENRVLTGARKYNTSREEYLRREHDVRFSCSYTYEEMLFGNKVNPCEERIMKGGALTYAEKQRKAEREVEETLNKRARDYCGYKGPYMFKPQLDEYFRKYFWCNDRPVGQ
jgi:hypothetical protein